MWKGKDQTTIYLNFSHIHGGPKNGQTVTHPLDNLFTCDDNFTKLQVHTSTMVILIENMFHEIPCNYYKVFAEDRMMDG